MIRLLLDQGLPRSAVAYLRNLGIDSVHTGDLGRAAASDAELLDLARQQERIVVTLDADFHALLALGQYSAPSVVHVRREGLRGEALARLLQSVLDVCGSDLAAGAAVVVYEKRIKVRRLPMVR